MKKVQLIQNALGWWFWYIPGVAQSLAYTRRRDAKRGLARFLAGVGSVEVSE